MSELCETAERHTYNVVTAQMKTLLYTRISSKTLSIIIKKNGVFFSCMRLYIRKVQPDNWHLGTSSISIYLWKSGFVDQERVE